MPHEQPANWTLTIPSRLFGMTCPINDQVGVDSGNGGGWAPLAMPDRVRATRGPAQTSAWASRSAASGYDRQLPGDLSELGDHVSESLF